MNTPAELLAYLDASAVHLFVGVDYPTGRRKLCIVADPHGAIDDATRWRMACWEKDLIAALLRRQHDTGESRWPAWVRWGPNALGLPVLAYPRADGSRAKFIQRLDGSWHPCKPQEVPDGT